MNASICKYLEELQNPEVYQKNPTQRIYFMTPFKWHSRTRKIFLFVTKTTAVSYERVEFIGRGHVGTFWGIEIFCLYCSLGFIYETHLIVSWKYVHYFICIFLTSVTKKLIWRFSLVYAWCSKRENIYEINNLCIINKMHLKENEILLLIK